MHDDERKGGMSINVITYEQSCTYTSSLMFTDLVWASAVSNITLPLKQWGEM